MKNKIANMFITLFNLFKDSFVQYYKSLGAGLKGINMKHLMGQVSFDLAICIAFSLFCTLREGTIDLYMTVFLPMFVANLLIIVFCQAFKSSNLISVLAVVLLTTGTALQIFMLDPNGDKSLNTVYTHIIFVCFGVIASVLAVPILNIISNSKQSIKYIKVCVTILTILLYLVLLVFGKTINGAQAWIIIGNKDQNLSIQVTEITKMLAMISFATILSDDTLHEKNKSRQSLITFFIHVGFLVVLSELGTLLVIGLVYFIVRLIYLKDIKCFVQEIVSVILIGALALAACYGFSKLPEKATPSNTAVEESTSGDEKATEQKKERVSGDKEATEQNEESVSGDKEATEQKKEDPSKFEIMMSRLKNIYPKVEKRFKSFFSAEDSSGTSGQREEADKAYLYVSWLGTADYSLASLPEYSSDFVFTYLIVRLGVIGAFLVILSFVALLLKTYVIALKSTKIHEAAIAIFFASTIVFQATICFFINIGIFPIIGLPFPFLANGGSTMVINLIMIIFIIFFARGENNLSNEVKENV